MAGFFGAFLSQIFEKKKERKERRKKEEKIRKKERKKMQWPFSKVGADEKLEFFFNRPYTLYTKSMQKGGKSQDM